MLFLLVLFLILRGGHFDFTLMDSYSLILGSFQTDTWRAAYMKGLENISVSRFIPILFTFPLLTILLSALLLKKRSELKWWAVLS